MDNNYFMTQEDIEKITKLATNTKKRDDCETWWYPLAEDYDGNLWAVVFAKGIDEEYPSQAYMKIAYHPDNYYMYEYDCDWLMPAVDDGGDIWDTEVPANPSDVVWLAEQWAEMINRGIVPFEEDEEDEEEDE